MYRLFHPKRKDFAFPCIKLHLFCAWMPAAWESRRRNEKSMRSCRAMISLESQSGDRIDYIISVLLWMDTRSLERIREVWKRTCTLSNEEPGAVFQDRWWAIWELESEDQISVCDILVGIFYRPSDQEEKVDETSFWRTGECVMITSTAPYCGLEHLLERHR